MSAHIPASLPTTRPFTDEENQVAHQRARGILRSSRDSAHLSRDHIRKIRRLTRYAQGKRTAQQTAEELGWRGEDEVTWDEDHVRVETQDWVDSPVKPVPLRDCWVVGVRAEDHPLVVAARAEAEKVSDKRDRLTTALRLRLHVAAGACTPEAAAAVLGVSLETWRSFCAMEDEADPLDDDQFREIGIVEGEDS